MSNTKTTILELRQQDTPESYVNSNGDWETILNEDVDINNGDSIRINQSFLDTAAFPDGTITIPDDLELRFQNYVYNTKWTGDPGTGASNTAPNQFGQWTPNGDAGSSGITQKDASPFVLCTRIEGGAGPGKTDQFLFSPWFRIDAIGNRSGFNTHFGGYTVVLEYQAPGMTGAERAYTNIQVPKLENYKGNYFQQIINITYEKNIGLTIQSPSKDKRQRNGGRTSFPNGGQTISTGDVYHPRILQRQYTLKAGNYTPNQLCKTINDKLQQNYGAGPVNDTRFSDVGPWTTSQFLVSSDSQSSGEGRVDSTSTTVETCTMMNMRNVSEGFLYLSTYAGGDIGNAKNIWIGASQVVLAYDSEAQIFFWEYMHSPLYNEGDESVALSVRGAPGQPDPPGELTSNSLFANIYNNGGIIWKSLTAYSGIFGEDSFQDVDFFGGILKFNLAQIYGPTYSMASIASAPFLGDEKPYWNYLPTAQNNYQPEGEEQAQAVGLTMTGGYIGLDNAIIKDGKLIAPDGQDPTKTVPFWACVPVPQPEPSAGNVFSTFNPIFSSVSATHTVDAADRMFKNTDIRSHYLIEIDAKFRNEFLTTNTNIRTMSQVVGKYYSKGSFTQSNGDGFIYTHSGEPMKLSSFKVRILNPDKSVATDIGADNTIFMTINRNPENQQLLVKQLAEFSDGANA